MVVRRRPEVEGLDPPRQPGQELQAGRVSRAAKNVLIFIQIDCFCLRRSPDHATVIVVVVGTTLVFIFFSRYY